MLKKMYQQNKLFAWIFLFIFSFIIATTITQTSTAFAFQWWWENDEKEYDEKTKDYDFSVSPLGNQGYPEGVDTPTETSAYLFYYEILSNSATSNCLDVLDGSKFEEWKLNDTMEDIYGAVKNIGIALLVVFFLAELLDKSTKQEYSLEILLRMLVKYFVMKAIMDNGLDILNALLNISNALVGSVGVSKVNPDQAKLLKSVARQMGNTGVMEQVAVCFFAFIVYLFTQLLSLMILATCYGRVFEIVLRGGFAPIGCASMVQEGFTGHGLRYVKKFFGACLQGVAIAGVLYIGTQIQTALIGSIFQPDINQSIFVTIGSSISLIIVPLTELMTIMKIGGIANDMAGA